MAGMIEGIFGVMPSDVRLAELEKQQKMSAELVKRGSSPFAATFGTAFGGELAKGLMSRLGLETPAMSIAKSNQQEAQQFVYDYRNAKTPEQLEELKIFDISEEQTPDFITQIYPGFGIETIFVKENYLFLGSRWGVYIYDITSKESPVEVSFYSHVYSCDPVVVSGDYAYSTLNSTGPCSRGSDQLDVIDISNINSPTNVFTIEMDSPKGLGISGNLLFVCDNGHRYS